MIDWLWTSNSGNYFTYIYPLIIKNTKKDADKQARGRDVDGEVRQKGHMKHLGPLPTGPPVTSTCLAVRKSSQALRSQSFMEASLSRHH